MPTWNELGGEFCSYTKGVEVGISGMIRKLLVLIYNSMVAIDEWKADIYDEMWLSLPTGHEIKIVNKKGDLVRFDTWIPEKHIGAVEYTIFEQSVICLLPYRHYASELDAVLAPIDFYWAFDTDKVRRIGPDGEPSILAWGVLSDTTEFAQYIALAYFFFHTLHGFGMSKVALHFIQSFFKWYKARKLRRTVEEIHSMASSIDEEVDQVETLLQNHLTKTTVRRILGQ